MTPSDWCHYHAVKAIARRRYPAAFPPKGEPPVPLALGIGVDLVTALLGEVAPWKVSLFLRVWTTRPEYHVAIASEGYRHNLDGSPTTAITEDHRSHAQAMLATPAAEDAA